MKNSMYYTLAFLLILSSCTHSESDKVTSKKDYDKFIANTNFDNINISKTNSKFWTDKLDSTPGQFPYLSKRASEYSNLFKLTYNVDYLIAAEKDLTQVVKQTNYTVPGYLRALASNYMAQHRFNDALDLLLISEENGEGLVSTQKMLFDVHLEMGQVDKAQTYLEKIKDLNDFDYLIRLAKWSDQKGRLDLAIKYMEQALTKAIDAKDKSLMQWSYTNLADFYGHDGNVEKSYAYFLKALELDPTDAYAKKGIAWIIYSHEKDGEEALHILNAVTENFHAPNYNLLKAEIAKFSNASEVASGYENAYLKAIEDNKYGAMYNHYTIKLLSESDPIKALELAKLEVNNRPTVQSYDLLAFAYYKNGQLQNAMDVILEHVQDKSTEPEILMHSALIYKATENFEKAEELKNELKSAAFELGPIKSKLVNAI